MVVWRWLRNVFFSFEGRVSRLQMVVRFYSIALISFFVLVVFVTIGTKFFEMSMDSNGLPLWGIMLASLPTIALLFTSLCSLSVRRMHDVGREGGDALLSFIWFTPIGFSAQCALFAAGDPIRNQYGTAPKGIFGTNKNQNQEKSK